MRIVGGNNGFHTVGPDQNSLIMCMNLVRPTLIRAKFETDYLCSLQVVYLLKYIP